MTANQDHGLRSITDDEESARREFLIQNPEADGFLGAMLDTSSEMLSELSGQPLSLAQQFRVFLLSQSWNAAAAGVQQLRSGYPRTSLMMSRFIFEGVAAASWAEADPIAAERCVRDYNEGKNWPVGTWPERKVTFEALDNWYDDAAQRLFKMFRDTDNALYSHALSDLALDATRADKPELEALLGPRTTALSTRAARHLMPTVAALVYAIARLLNEVTQGDTSEAARLHNEALAWSVKNPPPVHTKDRAQGSTKR